MKNRYWLILFFVLLLPVTLFFSFYKKNDEVNATTPTTHIATTMSKVETPKFKPVEHSVSIQHWKTTNGVPVYFVSTEGIPIIDIQLDFDAGSARDNEKPGLAMLCGSLLGQGIPNANADLIAEKLEDVGAQFNTDIDRDRTTISLRSLTDPKLLTPVISLFADLISSPTFPENNIETQRNQMIIGLKRNLQQPNIVANQAFFRTLYKNHPYAEPICGTIEAVSSITRADLIQFHQQYFVTNNATLTIVGGVSKAEAQNLADQIVQKLPLGNPAPALPDVTPLTQSIDIHIPFPAEQTHVLTGQPCATENDPDYFPLTVGNYILGGGMLTSRLFKEVRDERGLVYNVGSAVLQLQRPAPFVMKLQTKNSQAKEAIAVLQNTLTKFIKEGPTAQEVLEAKQAITRSFPIDISNNAKIIDVVSMMAFYKLPLDFLITYQKRINDVTIAEIKSVFERRIQPEKLGLIVVGTTSP